LMMGLFWGQGGMPKVTTTSLSSVRDTSSKFTKVNMVWALPWKVTYPSTTSVLHSCPGKKATTFVVKGVVGLGATILLYYRFILTVK